MGFELHINNINNLTDETVNDRPILKTAHRPKQHKLCAVTYFCQTTVKLTFNSNSSL